MRRALLSPVFVLVLLTAGCGPTDPTGYDSDSDSLRFEGETHLRNIRQLTFGGNNAEAYWSFDDSLLIMQSDWSEINPQGCDQQFVLRADGGAMATGDQYELVSTGEGRTTCGYFLPDGRVIYASTHAGNPECPTPKASELGRYVWSIFPDFDIYAAEPDGSHPEVLIGGPGYDAEARFFGQLVVSPESEALRGLFFASQMMKHATGISTNTDPRPVNKVVVLGGGLMGAGIATVSALKAGSTVRIKEVDDAGVGRALAHVNQQIARQVKRRQLRAFEGEQIMNKVTGSTAFDGLSNTDLVIEAVFESLDLKRSLLKQVEEVVGNGVVFASNTSSLPIGDIAAKAKRPEAVLGMHYFSPVEKMPLLEIIVTEDTADWATVTAVEYGKKQGKTVIVVKDGPGFYTTRILVPYTGEALYLLADGASVEAIDGAMVRWGFPVGPLLLSDEVGLDVGAHISQIMVDAFGDRMAGPDMMPGLLDDDRKGRKNGRGFYTYDEDGKRGGVDESVYSALGLGPRRQLPSPELEDRMALAMINEAARCLEDGILQSSLDGDMGAVMGLGFPPFRGGPFWWIDLEGAGKIVDRLDALAERHGDRFAAAQILRDHAESGKKFR